MHMEYVVCGMWTARLLTRKQLAKVSPPNRAAKLRIANNADNADLGLRSNLLRLT